MLQVMYYPQATPKAAGPTEVRRTPLRCAAEGDEPGPESRSPSLQVLAGSHFMPTSHLVETDWEGGRLLESPAGTIFITHYALMHRRARSDWAEQPSVRNMPKASHLCQSLVFCRCSF